MEDCSKPCLEDMDTPIQEAEKGLAGRTNVWRVPISLTVALDLVGLDTRKRPLQGLPADSTMARGVLLELETDMASTKKRLQVKKNSHPPNPSYIYRDSRLCLSQRKSTTKHGEQAQRGSSLGYPNAEPIHGASYDLPPPAFKLSN